MIASCHYILDQITISKKKRLKDCKPLNLATAVSECLRNGAIKKTLVSFVYS